MCRFRLLWVALLGLSLLRCTVPSLEDLWREKGFCAVGDEDCGMLRIRVDAQGFVPGCLKFEAQEDRGTRTLTATAPYRGTARAGTTLTQGFSPPKDWGLGVTVTVSAFEQGCDGNAVTAQSRQSTLREGGVSELAFSLVSTDADGDGYASVSTGGTDCSDERAQVNPGAAELCNEADDNCDGTNDEGLGVGEACTSDQGCSGVRVCGKGGTVTCFAQAAQYAWVDEDGDKHGDAARGQIEVCSSTLPPNRLPLSAPHDDCDDADSRVYPGATEVCNGRDDNCVDGVDEGFSLGQACTDPVYQCPGTVACFRDGGTQCLPSVPVPTWYPDDDLDNFGAPDGGIVSCPMPASGFVATGGDCDDGNPFIYPNAPELCDEQDNNCNEAIDEAGACSNGSPAWVTQIHANQVTFLAVSTYGDGGVWVVGEDSVRMLKTPQAASFYVLPDKCTAGVYPQGLHSVWAHPESGVAYIGRDEGMLIVQSPASADCFPRTSLSPSSATVTGLQGFVADGGVDIFGVVMDASKSNGGGTFRWNGGVATVTAKPIGTGQLRGIHGISPQVMFAVGDPASSAIYRYEPASLSWSVSGFAPSGVSLNAVHVVNPKLAYAVGTAGTMLRWDGTWKPFPGPPSFQANLTDVLAFGDHSIYVTSESGRVYRYNGSSWNSVNSGSAFYGIAGTRPDDIWAVGAYGQVSHYPGWPQ